MDSVHRCDSLLDVAAGRVGARSLKARHWQAFAAAVGLPQRAAAAANTVALAGASVVRLEGLPFTGSSLNAALSGLRLSRAELAG